MKSTNTNGGPAKDANTTPATNSQETKSTEGVVTKMSVEHYEFDVPMYIQLSNDKVAFEATLSKVCSEVEVAVELPKSLPEIKKLRDNRRLTYNENFTRFRNTIDHLTQLEKADLDAQEKAQWKATLEADLVKYLKKMVTYLAVYNQAQTHYVKLGGSATKRNKKEFFDSLTNTAKEGAVNE
jgi:hypothetical protein